mmetsp:Transcript_19659/g.26938  ORF Transcript_19659/g.26938 Transcript_19659/m.26938 type:complete len:86 (+) Transcript_19659:2492-2749(+)
MVGCELVTFTLTSAASQSISTGVVIRDGQSRLLSVWTSGITYFKMAERQMDAGPPHWAPGFGVAPASCVPDAYQHFQKWLTLSSN